MISADDGDYFSCSGTKFETSTASLYRLSGTSPFCDMSYEATLVNIALNRYDAVDLYENITTEALKFLYKVMKRMPRLVAETLMVRAGISDTSNLNCLNLF